MAKECLRTAVWVGCGSLKRALLTGWFTEPSNKQLGRLKE